MSGPFRPAREAAPGVRAGKARAAAARLAGIAAAGAARVRALRGWRRWGAAFGAGGVSALTTPPFGLWPLLALTLPLLVLLLDGCRAQAREGFRAALRAACATGWWFGFGYFVCSLWWIGNALLVDAEVFAWLLPLAVLALPAGLALFTALGTGAAFLLWSRGPGRLCALATGLGGAEWLRGHVLTGFPWNSFGYAPAEQLALAQGAALLGFWGYCLAVLLVFAAPVLLLDRRKSKGGVEGGVACAGLAAVVLAAAFGLGQWRLQASVEDVPGVRLRVMQPAVPQDQKFSYARRFDVVDDYLELSRQPSARYPDGLADVTLLIWPESAFPFIYEREPWAAKRIAGELPPNVTLVTGAARMGKPPPGQTSSFFNSIRVIAADGTVLQSADKVHLVPFGEYLPFQQTLEALGLQQVTRQRGGFASGARLAPLTIPGAPEAAPLICYEAIFPGAVVPDGPRPGFLLNVTNDAWFGLTPGPHQHFLQSRLRAIEEGLPLVRAANTGISAVIDPLGRIVASLPLGAKGVVDAPLPQPLVNPPLGARFGFVIFLAMYLSAFAIAGLCALPLRTRDCARKS